MAKDAIDLDSVRIRYDHRDGAFRITSADPRLKGKPFQLTLSRDSNAVTSLVQLFKDEGIIGPGDLIPRFTDLQSAQSYLNLLDEYTIAGIPKPHRDSRLRFLLGKSSSTESIAIDLSYAAHTLITGDPGAGKTEALIALAAQATEKGGSVWILDPLNESYSSAVPQLREVRSGGGLQDSRLIAEAVQDELYARLESLNTVGADGWADYEAAVGPMEPVFLFADSLEQFGAEGWISDILGYGARVGIFLFATVQRADLLSASIAANRFERRIALGLSSHPDQQDSAISPRLLSNLGRAVLRTGSSRPMVFQLISAR